MTEEHVLVVPAEVLNEIGSFHGFRTDVESLISQVLNHPKLHYMPRSLAEEDPSFKQLIPYAFLTFEDCVFVYRRGGKGSENRLHEKWSIGIGGHICSDDGVVGKDAYKQGFFRELNEELTIHHPMTESIVGLVYDDLTAVGQVHLGIIHRIELTSNQVDPSDEAVCDPQFMTKAQMENNIERFESWSKFILESKEDVLFTSNDSAVSISKL